MSTNPLILSFAFFLVSASALALDKKVVDPSLVIPSGEVSVVCFLSTECPLAKLYAPRLVSLANEFKSQGVAFLGVDSCVQDTAEELSAFATQWQIPFPLHLDPQQRIADQLGATRVSEVFLLDAQGEIRYRGRIDDQYEPGVARASPTRNYLQNAVRSLLLGEPVPIPVTTSVGCLITRVERPKPGNESAPTVTYVDDIAPLLRRQCVECHRAGEIGPFSLTEYQEVLGWAEMIREVTEQNRMPPWHADSEVNAGAFIGERRLTKEEKRLIDAWVEQGMPQGKASEDRLAQEESVARLSGLGKTGWESRAKEFDSESRATKTDWESRAKEFDSESRTTKTGSESRAKEFDSESRATKTGSESRATKTDSESRTKKTGSESRATGWYVNTPPDAEFTMRQRPFTVPAEGTVEYQYFVVDPGWKEDRWVRAAQVIPGQPAVVHHVIVFTRPPDHGEFHGIGWLGAYVPGQRNAPFPDGYARRVPAGSKLIFQLHYTPNGSVQEDQSRLGVWFANESEIQKEVFTLVAIDHDFEIPPGESNHEVNLRMESFAGFDELLGVMPHMHLRGRSFRLTSVMGKESRPLLNVPRYDFNWQHFYQFRQPLPLAGVDRLEMKVRFDNSEDNPTNPDPTAFVYWGDQTWNEMAVAFLDVSRDRFKVDARVTTQVNPTSVTADPNKVAATVQKLMVHDRNRDGILDRAELPTAFRFFGFHQFDENHNGRLERYEIENAARRQR
jgi:thiol-disulfide isomerase/thioredoxin